MTDEAVSDLGLVRQLKIQNTALREENEGLKRGGGGGTSPPMTEEGLKPRVDFLQTAFLWLAGAIVTVALALAGLIVTVTNSTNGRTDEVIDAVASLDRQVGIVGAKQDDTNQRLDSVDKKLDSISDKLNRR